MRPRSLRIRPRPGSLERPVSARIYRGTWIVVAIPILIAAFSVSRQQPLVAPALRSSFDEDASLQTIRDMVVSFPDRSPGAAGGENLLAWINKSFTSLGLQPKTDHFSADIPGLGSRDLANVSLTVRGRSPSSILIVANRDNSGLGPGANDNASGTAVMLELARAYENRPGFVSPPEPAHTIIFLSTDGGAFGSIGAAHFASHYATKEHVAAVIVLDSVAGPGKPRLLINGDAARSPAPVLVATAYQLLESQPGVAVTYTSPVDQLLDLAFPFSLYEQAPFVARGIPAVTFTTAGDRPPSPLTDTVENASKTLSKTHLATIGRTTEQLIAALDQGAPEPHSGSAGYIYLGGRFVSGWALQLVLIVASLPALVAIVDLFARCRRRHIPMRPAFRSLGRRLGFWLFLLALFLLFALIGLWPGGVSRPLSPDSAVATSPRLGAVVLFGFLAFGAWIITRERLLPRRETSSEDDLAGYSAALILLAGVTLIVVFFNRYTLLFLLPPLHAWIWLPQLRHLRPWATLGTLLVGLLGPLLLYLELASRLHLGLSVVWYVSELAAVGYLSLPSLIVLTAFATATAQLAALGARRYAPYPPPSERPERSLPQRATARLALVSKIWGDVRDVRRARRG